MNKDILNSINQEFINNNLNSDITSLLLKTNHSITVDIKLLAEQIEAKKRCQKKLPTWFNSENIYYPNKLNIEQTSSEITAIYKSELVSGNSFIDLTGGFGVDSYYLSKRFNKVTHCEQSQALSDIAHHNFKQLKVKNVACICADGFEYLKQNNGFFDWIYLDPSRRHHSKGKVFLLKDCLPNVPKNLILLFKHTNNVIVKTAPLLDIAIGIKELSYVKTIHIVAVNNEVKELLWILEKGYSSTVSIKTINIKPKAKEEFSFLLDNELKSIPTYSEPLSYLYEPNAAILKSGAFKLISERLKVKKLHKNSHLYTSDHLIKFPGRSFKIDKVMLYNKKLLKKEFVYNANIAIRNFPESVNSIRTKFKIREGGHTYVFFTTNYENKRIVLICTKTD